MTCSDINAADLAEAFHEMSMAHLEDGDITSYVRARDVQFALRAYVTERMGASAVKEYLTRVPHRECH